MPNEALDSFNERSTVVLTVAFLDDEGEPVTPTAATYRVDDKANRRNIVPPTSVGSLSSSVDIEITSDQNFIIRSRRDYEIRTVTVEFDYDGGTKHGTAEYNYKLVNLYGVVDVVSASISPSSSASPSV
jgi:hypothetical protein